MACRCFSSSMIRECRHHCQPKHNAISSGYATLSGGCALAAVVCWLPSGPIGTLVKCMLMQAWHAFFSLLYHKNSCVANRKRRFVKQTKRICLPKISLLFSVQIRVVWFSFNLCLFSVSLSIASVPPAFVHAVFCLLTRSPLSAWGGQSDWHAARLFRTVRKVTRALNIRPVFPFPAP